MKAVMCCSEHRIPQTWELITSWTVPNLGDPQTSNFRDFHYIGNVMFKTDAGYLFGQTFVETIRH